MSKAIELVSYYQPAGDQPTAIKQLLEGWKRALLIKLCLG